MWYANMYVLKGRLNLQVNSFQPRLVCFNLGQLVSTQVSLGQVQNIGHRSLFCPYRNYPKHSLKLTLGLSRSKQKFLGLMLALVNGYGCFCIGTVEQ